MPAWQVADSLDTLLAQLNTLAPARSRASDGSIGDAAHASRSNASDHNPWWSLAGQAYVTARDYTHDVTGGLDCAWLAAALMQGRDQRVKYVIWNRQIMAGAAGPSPWVWRPYSGTNPHTKHLHLSVVADARALSRIPWLLPGLTTSSRDEVDMATLDELRQLVREEIAAVRDLVWQAPIDDVVQGGKAQAWQHLQWAAGNAAYARGAAEHTAKVLDEQPPAGELDETKRYRLVPDDE